MIYRGRLCPIPLRFSCALFVEGKERESEGRKENPATDGRTEDQVSVRPSVRGMTHKKCPISRREKGATARLSLSHHATPSALP